MTGKNEIDIACPAGFRTWPCNLFLISSVLASMFWTATSDASLWCWISSVLDMWERRLVGCPKLSDNYSSLSYSGRSFIGGGQRNTGSTQVSWIGANSLPRQMSDYTTFAVWKYSFSVDVLSCIIKTNLSKMVYTKVRSVCALSAHMKPQL